MKDKTLGDNAEQELDDLELQVSKRRCSRAKERALIREFIGDEPAIDKEEASKHRKRVKALIRTGLKTDFVTHQQIFDCIPLKVFNEDALEAIVSILNDVGVAVFEEAPDAARLLMMRTGTGAGSYATIGELVVDDDGIEFNEDPAGSPPILTRPISDFDLPEDIVKRLGEAGLSRVADLAYRSDAELLAVPGTNELVLGQIRDAFLRHGLRIGDGACAAVASVCSQKWDALSRTEDPKVRFCAGCRKDVHRCESANDLVDALLARHCVAVIHDPN